MLGDVFFEYINLNINLSRWFELLMDRLKTKYVNAVMCASIFLEKVISNFRKVSQLQNTYKYFNRGDFMSFELLYASKSRIE